MRSVRDRLGMRGTILRVFALGALLLAACGTAAIAIEAQAGGQQLGQGLSTSLLLPPPLS